ncbi:uncharacterized protein LOC131958119 isoform X2 [Physella acuta]|uniref:uncharacterized protein LOC131958119 isoform X2 n=1 Tax=Physella acuta TaxID=109671 RepID=UPI0027DE72FC|nr:uncharacterized protein LOC131958119 isoform X2 [Physella acuta]
MRLVLIPLLVLVATVRAETDVDVNDEAVELNRRLLDQLLGGLLGGGGGGGLLGGILGGNNGSGLLGGLLGGSNGLLGGLLGGDGGLVSGVLGEKGLVGSLLGPNGPVGGILNSLVGPLVDQLLGPKGLLAGLGLNKGLVGNLVKTLSQTLGLDVGEILEIVGKILCLIRKLGLGVVIQLVKILQLDVLLSLNNFLCNANGSRLFDLNVVVNGTAQIGGIDCLLNTVTSVVGLDYLLPSVKSILGTGLNEKCKTPAGNSLIKGVFDLLGKVLNPELVKRVVVLLNAVDLTDLTVSVPKILKALECLLEYFGVGLKLDFLLNLLNVVGLKAVIGAEVQFCNSTNAGLKADALLNLNGIVGLDIVGALVKSLGISPLLDIITKITTELGQITLDVLRVVLCLIDSLGLKVVLDLFNTLNVTAILGLSAVTCSQQGTPALLSAAVQVCRGPTTPECEAAIQVAFDSNPCADVCGACEQLVSISVEYQAASTSCLDKCSLDCPAYLSGSATVTTPAPGSGGIGSGR